ncbi:MULTISPECIES: hypothetical protein, partial [unclassified Pseudomonas]|uniref:hypothetical protein n=1 Tax=unclassified Pseudomonas TaxID=196821 RepID=UPI0011AF238A
AVEHLGQFSVGRRASTGSVFGQRQQAKALRGFQIPVLTAVQADMALEALEEEATIERQIDDLRQKQANISSFLWPI